MYVTISARHCRLPDPIRRYADERVRRLTRFNPHVVGAEINFDLDHGVHRVEARLSVPGGPAIVARGSGEGFRTALDRTTDRLRRQLKSRRERRTDHQADKPSKRLAPAGGR